MSVSSTTDPVQTVLDLLENASASDWSNANGTPRRIARSSAYKPSDKAAYEAGDALYVYQSGTEGIASQGTDTYTENYAVSVDIWTLDGWSHVEDLARDVQGILNDYWMDNTTTTSWVTIRPFTIQDYRHETFGDHGQHDRKLVEGRLMRIDDI